MESNMKNRYYGQWIVFILLVLLAIVAFLISSNVSLFENNELAPSPTQIEREEGFDFDSQIEKTVRNYDLVMDYVNSDFGYSFSYPSGFSVDNVSGNGEVVRVLDVSGVNKANINYFTLSQDENIENFVSSFIVSICDANGPNISVKCSSSTKLEVFNNSAFGLDGLKIFFEKKIMKHDSGVDIFSTVGPAYVMSDTNGGETRMIIIYNIPGTTDEFLLEEIASSVSF